MKRLGCCTLCDREVFEVVSIYRKGPLQGQPRQIGAPLPNARRVHLVFMDGTNGSISTCGECEVTPQNLPEIDYKLRELAAAQSTNGKREDWGGSPLSLRDQWIHGAVHLRAANNPPLGVLFVETWQEAMEREHGSTAR